MQDPLALILTHRQNAPSRTWSIILTLFGDAIIPRGGSTWLGTILAVTEGMGIGSGVVRTAMSRLTADGWVMRTRVGRNSYYRLSDRGSATFAEAELRIYGQPDVETGSRLRLALPINLPEEQPFRDQMADQRFVQMSPGAWLGPEAHLRQVSPSGDLPVQFLMVDGTVDGLRLLVARNWRLDRIAQTYERFLVVFRPLAQWLDAGQILPDREALVARILLIHEFRRAVLRDPHLPDTLLPERWPGHEAHELCARIYHSVLPAAERWLDAHGLERDGPLPPPDPSLFRRLSPEASPRWDHVTNFS